MNFIVSKSFLCGVNFMFDIFLFIGFILISANINQNCLSSYLQTHPPTPIPLHCFLVGNATQVKFWTLHFSSLSGCSTFNSSATKMH